MQEEIKSILRDHRRDEELFKIDEINVKKGTNKILLTAPHTFGHKSKGRIGIKDPLTYQVIRVLSELSNCHVIYVNQSVDYDPGSDVEYNFYYDYLKKYTRENEIDLLIDIRSIKEHIGIDIITNDYKNIDKKTTLEVQHELLEAGLKKVTIDAEKGIKTSPANRIVKDFDIDSLRLLIENKKFKEKELIILINALLDVITYIEKREKFKIVSMADKYGKKEDIKSKYIQEIRNEGTFDYTEKYDKILDIKPAFGYKRALPEVIRYDWVGLEIEVSVTLERDKYSLIGKLLKNIKELVGKRGYFVKDYTVMGDYQFEIVLDPLPVEDIYDIWNTLSEITHFSGGLIQVSKEKNCCIHMNFNQYDITDKYEAHKRLTALLSEKEDYFEENIYKQYKFIWDFDEYCKYQSTVSSKYLWINYLDTKLVEVRNIRTTLNPTELIILIKKILEALFYDRNNIPFDYQAFTSLSKIYDTAFDKVQTNKVFNDINDSGFVVISLKDKKGKVVSLSEELRSKIKEEL